MISLREKRSPGKRSGGATGADRDIYILSACSPAAHNIYKTAINGFIGTPFNSRAASFREIRVAKRGLYLGLEFSGSWEDFIFLSNHVYLKYLPELGLYRREGYDIERFVSSGKYCFRKRPAHLHPALLCPGRLYLEDGSFVQ